jgi:late competence protein required for DNA uptake (superfamily II DNA/RNA helicase)
MESISTTIRTSSNKRYFSSQTTLAVDSAVTDRHDRVQELRHGGKGVAMTLTALLEEGMCEELTS